MLCCCHARQAEAFRRPQPTALRSEHHVPLVLRAPAMSARATAALTKQARAQRALHGTHVSRSVTSSCASFEPHVSLLPMSRAPPTRTKTASRAAQCGHACAVLRSPPTVSSAVARRVAASSAASRAERCADVASASGGAATSWAGGVAPLSTAARSSPLRRRLATRRRTLAVYSRVAPPPPAANAATSTAQPWSALGMRVSGRMQHG